MILETARKIVQSVRYFANVGKRALQASFKTTFNIIRHFPEYIRRFVYGFVSACKLGLQAGVHFIKNIFYYAELTWYCFKMAFRFGLEAGKFLIEISYKLAKYVFNNFFKIVSQIPLFLWDLSVFVLNRFTDIAQLFFDVTKFILRNSLNFAQWACDHIVEIISNVAGIVLGLLLSPFLLIHEFIFPTEETPHTTVFTSDKVVDQGNKNLVSVEERAYTPQYAAIPQAQKPATYNENTLDQSRDETRVHLRKGS